MRLATVRRTSLCRRSTSNFVIESIFGPRKYDVTWARASAESRPETNSAEQRIFAVPATRQLSGSLGGTPGCATAVMRGTASASAASAGTPRNVRRVRAHRAAIVIGIGVSVSAAQGECTVPPGRSRYTSAASSQRRRAASSDITDAWPARGRRSGMSLPHHVLWPDLAIARAGATGTLREGDASGPERIERFTEHRPQRLVSRP